MQKFIKGSDALALKQGTRSK